MGAIFRAQRLQIRTSQGFIFPQRRQAGWLSNEPSEMEVPHPPSTSEKNHSLRSPVERMQALRELVDAYDSGLERHLSEKERTVLPLALARTPLKYARHLLLRTSVADQRAVALAEAPQLEWALSIAKLPGPWQAAFR